MTERLDSRIEPERAGKRRKRYEFVDISAGRAGLELERLWRRTSTRGSTVTIDRV
jgi:hypothetical protein